MSLNARFAAVYRVTAARSNVARPHRHSGRRGYIIILLYKALGWCSTVAGYTCSRMHENNINCTTHVMYGGGGGVELRAREAAQGQSDWKKK